MLLKGCLLKLKVSSQGRYVAESSRDDKGSTLNMSLSCCGCVCERGGTREGRTFGNPPGSLKRIPLHSETCKISAGGLRSCEGTFLSSHGVCISFIGRV